MESSESTETYSIVLCESAISFESLLNTYDYCMLLQLMVFEISDEMRFTM